MKLVAFANTFFVHSSVGFNLWTQPRRAWSRIGKRPKLSCPSAKGQNISLIVAVTPVHGLVHHMVCLYQINAFYVQIYDGTLTASLFGTFVKDLVGVLIQLEGQFVIVCDNASSHSESEFEQLKGSNSGYLYLPPYSPQLNPAEGVFSIVKNACRYLDVLSVLSQQETSAGVQS